MWLLIFCGWRSPPGFFVPVYHVVWMHYAVALYTTEHTSFPLGFYWRKNSDGCFEITRLSLSLSEVLISLSVLVWDKSPALSAHIIVVITSSQNVCTWLFNWTSLGLYIKQRKWNWNWNWGFENYSWEWWEFSCMLVRYISLSLWRIHVSTNTDCLTKTEIQGLSLAIGPLLAEKSIV